LFWLTILQVLLEGVKGALTADSLLQDGWYEKVQSKGLRAAARVYSGWGFSQTFYWNEVRILESIETRKKSVSTWKNFSIVLFEFR
jgi:hypothetical protein